MFDFGQDLFTHSQVHLAIVNMLIFSTNPRPVETLCFP